MSERGGDQGWLDGDRDFIREWVTSEQNRSLADHIVITDGCTPAEVAARISALVT